ncbi:hypothetical protein K432DRAFT_262736, partial [Lepidopterella palustris CBS 459.81]
LVVARNNLNLNHKDKCGKTLLACALEAGATEIIHLLFQHKDLGVHIKDDYGRTTLARAIYCEKSRVVELSASRLDI